jgi:ATP-dependent DNA helicase RecQ
MHRSQAQLKLKQTFGHNSFREGQWETIEKVLHGKRVLLIEKTGFGKSLCYQFPATHLPGLTVIFSPLIALMRDQVNKLQSLGIAAACINSEQEEEENERVLERAKRGQLKILYIAPERQENQAWIDAVRQMTLSMVVIDEAHCISTWGHDFRPSFRRIVNLVRLLPAHMPVLATTATATAKVQEDIVRQIGKPIEVVRGDLMRPNFDLSVVKVNNEHEKLMWLGQHMPGLTGNGVIYTGTRVNTDIYARWLRYLNVDSIAYNAGLDGDSRREIERGLLDNRWKCVVSTNALGMGIDKPDLRFIIHTQVPVSPIHYYQEIGRAGRDGKPAQLILLFAPEDLELPRAFIEGAKPSLKKYDQVINALSREPLGQFNLIRRTNLKQTEVRVIVSDLMDQGIVRQVVQGKRKTYELVPGAPALDTAPFESLRQHKMAQLDEMIRYMDTGGCRMAFLRNYLGDKWSGQCGKCDNDTGNQQHLEVSTYWEGKVKGFHDSFFPILEVESKASRMTNGVAASYYGFSEVGSAIHRSKYEGGGDFPDFLLRQTLRAYRKTFGNKIYDLVLYVPPTKSGELVKNFAHKVGRTLKFPVSDDLIKTRLTDPQKIFQTGILKRDNVKGAFEYVGKQSLEGKRILLIDDIFDSGHTLKEIGRYLSKQGAVEITPLVIAKTIGQ